MGFSTNEGGAHMLRHIALFAGINSASAQELLPLLSSVDGLEEAVGAGNISTFWSALGSHDRDDAHNVLVGSSYDKLNAEAEAIAARLTLADVFGGPAPATLGVMLVAPKTHKPSLPVQMGATSIRQVMFWSPDDAVPNQRLFGGNLNAGFFDPSVCLATTVMIPMRFGEAYNPHSFASYLRNVPILARNRAYDRPPIGSGNHMPPPAWLLSGTSTKVARRRPQDVLERWVNEVECVVIAHSQGANIALATLGRLL